MGSPSQIPKTFAEQTRRSKKDSLDSPSATRTSYSADLETHTRRCCFVTPNSASLEASTGSRSEETRTERSETNRVFWLRFLNTSMGSSERTLSDSRLKLRIMTAVER